MPRRKICEPAALHIAAGALKDQDVPIGRHDLSDVRVILTFGQGVAVDRGPGGLGDGFDEYTATSKGISLAAVLLFLSRCSQLKGPQAKAVWLECIRESIERGTKAEEHLPEEATQAMDEIKAELTQQCTARRRTPARRLGLESVVIEVETPPRSKPPKS